MTQTSLSPVLLTVLGLTLSVAGLAACGGSPGAAAPSQPGGEGAAPPGTDGALGEENELGAPGAPATSPHQMGNDPGRTPEMGDD